jgi:hypothetical protein
MLRHLQLIAASAPAGLKLELAWGPPESGPRRARCLLVSQIHSAAEAAATLNATGNNIYVGTTIKSADSPSNRRTSASHAALATCLAIDIDANLIAGARKLPHGIKPQLMAVSGTKPELRGHLWMSLQPTSDLDLLEDVNERAILACGGDMAARGRGLLMRLVGTVSYPSERKRRRGYCVEMVSGHFINAPTYTLAELSSAFPRQPMDSASSPSLANPRVLAFPCADVRRVEDALDLLPFIYVAEYGLWIRVGLALHSFDPGLRGLFLWRKFSQRCPAKAAVTDFEYRWSTFGRRGANRQLTIRWLFAQARKHAPSRLTSLPSSTCEGASLC